ncbi:MAG: type II toxin-antitoxin system VapB family antitoxin [Candidatus Aminicenantes bacterium]|nr:type II toxin-antitoxin system VapB family antitoxin [Candidatus Aminicenantes bacterium]NLH77968.1 type II toxin-antitoxin system VapB family antitoxin [Acidobacteriota bacterium]
MASHMKTTIHIPDSLFEEAKKIANREKTTLKALVEEGLRKVVLERDEAGRGEFKLRPASFKGQGLNPRLEGAGWDRVLDLSYEDRG